jgi:hypothetical protein
MNSRWLQSIVAAGVLVAGAGSEALAQSAEQVRARIEVGAGFLKSGDIELATKTFTQVLDADATNWQARALLTLAYLTARDLAKVDTELRRLKAQNVPATTVAALERQVTSTRRTIQQRDELTGLLAVGKWQEALTKIDAADAPDSRKRLLNAYVFALRGEFDEARRLTSDSQFTAFNASLEKRSAEFQIAREKAIVALNFLGARYCGGLDWMFRCPEQPPLSRNQQAAWDEIRSGNGKVSSRFMAQKPKGSGEPFTVYFAEVGVATQLRVNAALVIMNQFVSTAPLHPEALQASVVMSLYSGSRDIARAAADRSLNSTGVWALSTRRCRSSNWIPSCWVGKDKLEKDLPIEGLVALDGRSRVLRYYAVQPKAWLTSMLPPQGMPEFEVPFQQLVSIKSIPELKNYIGSDLRYMKSDATLFDFGPKKSVRMLLDFTFPLAVFPSRDVVATALKGVEDVVNIMGQLIPSAKIDYLPNFGGRSFDQLMGAALGTAVIIAGSATGDVAAVAQGRQTLQEQAQLTSQSAATQAEIWRAMSDLKTQDGKSIVDAAFEDEGLKKDLDALLTLALQ